jgi:hypothetical protein
MALNTLVPSPAAANRCVARGLSGPAPRPKGAVSARGGARGRARRDGGAAASAVGGDGYGAEADHDSREPAQAAEHGDESDNPQDAPTGHERQDRTGSGRHVRPSTHAPAV